MRNMGFRLAAGSVKTARCWSARRRVVFTVSAASSTIVAGGNGSSDLNKGTFLSRRKGDIFIEARHKLVSLLFLNRCFQSAYRLGVLRGSLRRSILLPGTNQQVVNLHVCNGSSRKPERHLAFLGGLRGVAFL